MPSTLTLVEEASDDVDPVVAKSVSRPALKWSSGAPVLAATSARTGLLSKRHRVVADVVAVTSEDGGGDIRVPITFDRRTVVAGTGTLSGADESGTVKLRLSGTPDGSAKVNLIVDPPDAATPREILRVMNLFEALRSGAKFGVWFPALGSWGFPPAEPIGIPSFPPDQIAGVRGLARLQASTGVEFPMPEVIDEGSAHAANRALVLLSGRAVQTKWSDAQISLGREEAEAIGLDVGRQAPVSTDLAYEIQVAGHDIYVGVLRADFAAARVELVAADAGEDEVTVHLVPGASDAVALALVDRAHFDPFERLDALVVPIERPDGQKSLSTLLA